MTLLELVVALAVLSIVAAVAGLTMHTASAQPAATDLIPRLTALRDSALATGHPVTATFEHDGKIGIATAYPDGRLLSDVGDVERTTGRPHAAR